MFKTVFQRDFLFFIFYCSIVDLQYVPISAVFQRDFTDVSTHSEELIQNQKVAGMGTVNKMKEEGMCIHRNTQTYLKSFKIDFIFWSSLRFIVKLSGKYREFLSTLCPPTWTASPAPSLPPAQSGTFITVDEPTLTHHHPEFVVCVRVHSWSCRLCGLLFFFFFWLCHAACGILVPRPGMEPVPPAVEAWCSGSVES